MIDMVKFTVGPAEGLAGAASATAYSQPVSGRVVKTRVEVQGGHANTQVRLLDENAPVDELVLILSPAGADSGAVYPRRSVSDHSGAEVYYSSDYPIYDQFVVHGRIKALLTLTNPGAAALVTVWLE
jgi:hypothetical protein